MKKKSLSLSLALLAANLCLVDIAPAGTPLWTFTPLTATTITLSPLSTATVQYTVTNQSNRSRVLVMRPIVGVTQLTSMGLCPNPFTLAANASCTLSLRIDGELLTQPIIDGPTICAQGSLAQCYRPTSTNVLRVTTTSSDDATISVSGSPLSLDTNGSTGVLTINNTSSSSTATNITSNFISTALDGNVTETGNTCTSVSPMSSCTLTFTPGNTAVPQTNFNIAGSNTNTITAAIVINQSQNPGPTLSNISPTSGITAGGTSFTLSGTNLAGVVDVTLGGVSATSITIINNTTITGITPAHAAGVVDVIVTTGQASDTLTNAFTYA